VASVARRSSSILVFVKKYDNAERLESRLPRVILDIALLKLPLYYIYVCERVGTLCDSTFHMWLTQRGDKLLIIHGELHFNGVYSPPSESTVRKLAEHGVERAVQLCRELNCSGIELASRTALLVEVVEPLLSKYANSRFDQK
jgi:hypothetical protein